MRKLKQKGRLILSILIVLAAGAVIWFIREDQAAIAVVTLIVAVIELIVNLPARPASSPEQVPEELGPSATSPRLARTAHDAPAERAETNVLALPRDRKPTYSGTADSPGKAFHPPFSPILDSVFVSRFTGSRDELDTVLALRRSFFADSVVSSDASYEACWKRNHYAFKIIYVHENNQARPLGYWGLIPIDIVAFKSFLRGKISHEEMLMEETRDWCEIDPANTYIYVIGAVLPDAAHAASPLERWYVKIMSSRILIDMFEFAEVISSLFAFKGICGYPSQTGGADIFSKLSFRQNGVYIDGDESQPVSYVAEEEIERLLREIRYYTEKHGHLVYWEEPDKERFLLRIEG